MDGLKIGHYTDKINKTGLSVFIFETPAMASYHIAGAAPASRELAPLLPESSVQNVHGLLLTGGSAYGINAAQGLMEYLQEQKLGVKVPHGVVPIVPAAGIYDMAYGQAAYPNASNAYQACKNAMSDTVPQGQVGVGAGATIGKIIPNTHAMQGGFGMASVDLGKGITVQACVVVNAVGDIYDQRGNIIAGAKTEQGFINTAKTLLEKKDLPIIFHEFTHTSLAAIFTNGQFTKAELKHIAKMASAGMARAISPVFTGYDGDLIFAVSLGEKKASPSLVGIAAAEALHLAILNAVKDAKII